MLEAIAQAECGEFIEEEEMDARPTQMLRSRAADEPPAAASALHLTGITVLTRDMMSIPKDEIRRPAS